jgi:hypothetical protein
MTRSDCEPVTEPKTRRERRDAVDAIKLAHGCQVLGCAGYPRSALVLSFDHLDPSPEDFSISAAVMRLKKQRVSNIRPRWTYPTVTWADILAEIAKCEVVCLHCHALRTAERGRKGVQGRSEYGESRDAEALRVNNPAVLDIPDV